MSQRIFSKRNSVVAIATFVVGLCAVIALARGVGAFAGVQNIFSPETTVKGQVTSYILDDAGAVAGLVLSSGDQLRFNRNIGEGIGESVKVGDEVAGKGRAGTSSSYGREIRVRQLTANNRTFVETAPDAPPPPRHAPGAPHAPKPPHAAPPAGQAPAAPDAASAPSAPDAPSAPNASTPPPPAPAR